MSPENRQRQSKRSDNQRAFEIRRLSRKHNHHLLHLRLPLPSLQLVQHKERTQSILQLEEVQLPLLQGLLELPGRDMHSLQHNFQPPRHKRQLLRLLP